MERNPGPWAGGRARRRRGGRDRGRNAGPQALAVVVWNVNGARAHSAALCRLLEEESPDLVLLQESRLTAGVPTPAFAGYNVVRRDRRIGRNLGPNTSAQGGLLTLVREKLAYTVLPSPAIPPNAALEFLSVKIHLPDGPLAVHNLYRPPARGGAEDRRDGDPQAQRWPWGRRAIFGGDLNAEGSWSDRPPADRNNAAFGNAVEEEAVLRDTLILNTPGVFTRVEGGNCTSPDVALASGDLAQRATWRVLEPAGSDHLPHRILLEGRRREAKTPPDRLSIKSIDWAAYQAEAKRRLLAIPAGASLEAKANQVARALVGAAESTAAKAKAGGGKKTPGSQSWWTAECAERRREYIRLLRHAAASPRHPASARAADDAREDYVRTINEAKRTAWRDFASTLDPRAKPSRVFSVLRSLAGLKKSRPPDESIVKEIVEADGSTRTKLLVTEKEKAREAVRKYAETSRVIVPKPISMEAYLEVREAVKERTKVEEPEASPFSFEEYSAAVQKSKGKAPGPDGIHPAMLKSLDDEAGGIILGILNESWTRGQVPAAWKKATILPILKPGKPPSAIKSFRPVALTSVIAKTLESMVAVRMGVWAERVGAVPKQQAGFRAGRSAEETVASIQASIFRGLNGPKPASRTLLAAVDIQAAFDGLWSGGALRTFARAGAPGRWIRWIRDWLKDRRARVRWGEALSDERVFKEGSPQGSPLSPLWFAIGTSPLAKAVEDEAPGCAVAVFADDISAWAQSPKLAVAARILQQGLNALFQAANYIRLKIAPDKSQALLATLDPSENIRTAPPISIGGRIIPYGKTLKILGVQLDSQARSTAQAEAAGEKMKQRTRVLQALAGASWGPSPLTLRQLYEQFVRPSGLYGAGHWFHYLSETNRKSLQRTENACARIIVGAPRGSPAEATTREAGLKPTDLRAMESGVALAHRMARHPPDHPAHEATVPPDKLRLKSRSAWATEVAAARRSITTAAPPPWRPFEVPPPWAARKVQISFHLAGAEVAKEDAPYVRLQAALKDIHDLDHQPGGPGRPKITVHSDGSAADGGVGRGGGGAVISWEGGAEESVREPAGALCSSTTAEAYGLAAALERVRDRLLGAPPEPPTAVRILFDSRALFQRLQRPAHLLTDLPTRRAVAALHALPPETLVQVVWVPGHAGLAGNERADKEAKAASLLAQDGVPVELGALKAALARKTEVEWKRRYLLETQTKGETHRTASEEGKAPTHLHLPIAQARQITALRLNRASHLASTMARWGLAESETCPHCALNSPETSQHFLIECPAWEQPRKDLKESSRKPLTLSCLQTCPEAVLTFLGAVSRIKADR